MDQGGLRLLCLGQWVREITFITLTSLVAVVATVALDGHSCCVLALCGEEAGALNT